MHLPGPRKERRVGGVCDSTLSSSREKVADVSDGGAIMGGKPRGPGSPGVSSAGGVKVPRQPCSKK